MEEERRQEEARRRRQEEEEERHFQEERRKRKEERCKQCEHRQMLLNENDLCFLELMEKEEEFQEVFLLTDLCVWEREIERILINFNIISYSFLSGKKMLNTRMIG